MIGRSLVQDLIFQKMILDFISLRLDAPLSADSFSLMTSNDASNSVTGLFCMVATNGTFLSCSVLCRVSCLAIDGFFDEVWPSPIILGPDPGLYSLMRLSRLETYRH